MAVVIRLSRTGTKKKPFYHVVVADKEACRDGKYLERLGFYNPKAKENALVVNVPNAQNWILKGAIMSETVGHLLKPLLAQNTAK